MGSKATVRQRACESEEQRRAGVRCFTTSLACTASIVALSLSPLKTAVSARTKKLDASHSCQKFASSWAKLAYTSMGLYSVIAHTYTVEGVFSGTGL